MGAESWIQLAAIFLGLGTQLVVMIVKFSKHDARIENKLDVLAANVTNHMSVDERQFAIVDKRLDKHSMILGEHGERMTVVEQKIGLPKKYHRPGSNPDLDQVQ